MTSKGDVLNVLNCHRDASPKYDNVHLEFGAFGDNPETKDI